MLVETIDVRRSKEGSVSWLKNCIILMTTLEGFFLPSSSLVENMETLYYITKLYLTAQS